MMRTNFILFFFGITLSLFIISCGSIQPMPAGSDKIKIVETTEEKSIDLFLKCKPVGKAEIIPTSWSNPYLLEGRAVEVNANVVQILYVEKPGRHVRFWNCL